MFTLYLYDDIQWSNEDRALAGYITGNGQHYAIPGSFTVTIQDIDSTSNVGKPGLWVFQIDHHSELVILDCQDPVTGSPTIQLFLSIMLRPFFNYFCNLKENYNHQNTAHYYPG